MNTHLYSDAGFLSGSLSTELAQTANSKGSTS